MEKNKELYNLYKKIVKEYDENQKEYLKLIGCGFSKETEKSLMTYLNSMGELKKQLKTELDTENVWCVFAFNLLIGGIDED